MLTYWLMYIIPAFIVFILSSKQQKKLMPWLVIGFFFIILIGFREDVGGDWTNYLLHYDAMQYKTLWQAVSYGDPGHQFLNWLSYQWELGVYGVNFVYGFVFMIGLVKLSRLQTYPWLALVVAVPYLITVVAMGYSRQAMAIGLFMWAISYLDKGRFKTYIALIFMAALFHKTALLLLPLGVFLYGKGKILRILIVIPVLYGAWDLLLAKEQETLWHNYVDANMKSQGAMIRVVMNLVPSLLLFIYTKEWKRSYNDYVFWFWIAVGSVLALVLVNISSTAVDRMALYFIPIQLVVFARLPYLARNKISPILTRLMIVLGYALVLFIWLNFSLYAAAWIPYNNLLFMDIM